MKVVAHAFFLGVHVAQVIWIGLNFNRDIFNHLETVSFKAYALDGIVCHQTHLSDTEEVEDLRADAIIAFVGFMTEVDICLNSVKAFFLELISSDFIHQAYTASFLIEVDYCPTAFFFNHLHGFMKLLSAITAL